MVVVRQEEALGGGGMTPRLADSTTTEDVLYWQPNKYLLDDDRLGQVVEDGHATDILQGVRKEHDL